MRKAITPIISIIVLLLITITLAGAGWNYLSGYYEGMTSKTIRLVYGSETDNEVTIMNTGTADMTIDDLIVTVDGRESRVMEMTPATLEPKKSARVKFAVPRLEEMDVRLAVPGNGISFTTKWKNDGIYWLDPDGPGGNEPFEAYCDAGTDGGGWIRIAKFGTSFAISGSTYTDGVGGIADENYAIRCDKFTAIGSDIVMRVNMGSVTDFFKPIQGQDLCTMLAGYTYHEWSNSPTGGFVQPGYYTVHLGGSAHNWPLNNVAGDSRVYLSFWGGNGAYSGCCHYEYDGAATWSRAFEVYVR